MMKPGAIYSPSNIEFLLWCHTRAEPHPRLDAPAIKEVIGMFERCGAIARVPEKQEWITTEMGKAWVAALCNVPPPTCAWVDDNGEILNP